MSPTHAVKINTMPRLQNGMIVFMRDQIIPGPKLLDIEVTNTFPLIALTKETYLIHPTQHVKVLRGYGHIAIPPDFRLHISGTSDHIFFDITPFRNMLENGSATPFHYFTVIGLPSRITQQLIEPGKTRKWLQAQIISPFKDGEFNPSTRLFIDFFLHSLPMNLETITNSPFVMEGLRLATDRHGSVLGPYSFTSLQRRKQPEIDLVFSIRFGFANIEDNESMYIYTPFEIFERRPRR